MKYSTAFLEYCNTLTLKLTSLRKAILYILWKAEKPIKAYDVLHRLLEDVHNAKPPTVYRILDYFVTSGVAHKIESIQSYTLCGEPAKRLVSEMLMVCNDCRDVKEVYDPQIHAFITELANDNAFQLNSDVIELKGLCRACGSGV